MKLPIKFTTLQVHTSVHEQSVHLGDLSYSLKDGSSVFQWSEEALKLGLEWSPLHCPLSSNLWNSNINDIRLLDGLPGFIHDALPDGWGLLLMDRAFIKEGVARTAITPVLRLAFVSNRTWGALSFEPKWDGRSSKGQKVDLAHMAQEAKLILDGDLQDVSKELVRASGGLQGARPKVFVALDPSNQHALVGYDALPPSYRHTIVKFAGQGETPSHPMLESLYLDAARRAGINTPASVLLDLDGTLALCLDRFDRQGDRRIHTHSLAGLLHTSHTIPNTDWTQVSNVLDRLGAPPSDKKEAFHRALFNAVFCVRDDHTKNMAFQRSDDGQWSLTPAFDVAYSAGPRGFHTMTYAHHQGQHVSTKDIQNLAPHFDVTYEDAHQWIQALQDARTQMLGEAKALGVQSSLLKEVKLQFKEIDKSLKKAPTKKLAR